MEAVQEALIGSLTALVAIVVVIGFTFAFVVAPLLAGGGAVLALLLYQVIRGHSAPSR